MIKNYLPFLQIQIYQIIAWTNLSFGVKKNIKSNKKEKKTSCSSWYDFCIGNPKVYKEGQVIVAF